MTEVLTSITTGGSGGTGTGISADLALAQYDLVVGEALRVQPQTRDFVSVRPQNIPAAGTSVNMERFQWLTEAQIDAATAGLDEETDVEAIALPKTEKVTLTPGEFGLLIKRTKYLAHRTFAPVDPFIARAVADSMVRVNDKLIQAKLDAGTNIVYGGDATGLTDLAATDYLTSDMVRMIVARMRNKGVAGFNGSLYACLTNSFVVNDLREESGPNGWRDAVLNSGNETPIWNGTIGDFEGARFVVNPHVKVTTDGTSHVSAVRSFFFGYGALAELAYEEPHVVIAPPIDSLGRFYGIGWYGDIDWAIYEPLALVAARTATSGQAYL